MALPDGKKTSRWVFARIRDALITAILASAIIAVLAEVIVSGSNEHTAPPGQVALCDERYRAAYDNCVAFLNDFGRGQKSRIDLGSVHIEQLPEIYRHCYTMDGDKHYFSGKNADYLLIIIGDRTAGHDFAYLVCNIQSSEVVGLIPIV